MAKGGRGNHGLWAPVETISRFPRAPFRHPWKRFKELCQGQTWKPWPTGTRGNHFISYLSKRVPVETGQTWKPVQWSYVETKEWFPRVPKFGNWVPVETISAFSEQRSDVETSHLVSTGTLRSITFPRVPDWVPVETDAAGQTWKRVPLETIYIPLP